jgi:serine/threonine-protein kinase
MGTVYLARDLQLDRQVAIKELPAEFAGDSQLRERFLREVRTAAGFSHPNLVPVYAVEASGHTLAYVMGLVEGESLAERVKRTGPLGRREAVRMLQDVGYALAYAHGRGVVHRDLKPDNIMLERATGRALLMDFGVARTITVEPTATAGMTRVGEVVGTPEFMSPEQATGDHVDGRSDLYALGLTAYYALTGVIPFQGESIPRILVRQLTETLPSLSSRRPDLPEALCAIVDRCMAKEREARFSSAEAMVEQLDAAQLAAPDVAVPIRVFVAELESLGLIGMFLSITAAAYAWNQVSRGAYADTILPITLLVAIFGGRVLQTRAEARRLRADGFTPAVIREGVRFSLEERDARRAQLRADPLVRQRRRRTIGLALLQLVMAPLLLAFATRFRVKISETDYVTSLPGIVLLISSLLCLGMGLVLLIRSPLRASLSERLVRVLALRWPSRWIVGPSGDAAVTTSPATSVPRTAVASPPPAVDLDARLARIEASLEALHAAQRNSQPLR